jgi:predicted O-methyltransferase YrrM
MQALSLRAVARRLVPSPIRAFLRSKISHLRAEAQYFIRNSRKPRLYDLSTPERVGCVYHQPTDMCSTDALMIYALVRGLRPKLALEIGVRWGNSGRIIANAMEENKSGRIVGVDPATENFRVKSADLHGRYTLLEGASPEIIPKAVEVLGGAPDFVFIDAMHVYSAVVQDFTAVLPYLAENAYILFHDTYHQGVDQAIRTVIESNDSLTDCGILTREPWVVDPVSTGGLRLVRKGPVNSERLIAEGYERAGRPVPPFSREFWDYDEYYRLIQAQSSRED